MEYISAPEAAKKWGISERRVQKTLRRKPHTRHRPFHSFMANTKGRRKAER